MPILNRLVLQESEYQGLLSLAQTKRRTLKAQAAVLIREALEREGVLQPEPANDAQPAQEPAR